MAKTGQDATFYQNNYVVLRFTVVDEDIVGEPALDISTYRVFYSLAKLGTTGLPITASPVIDVDSTDDPTVVVKTTPVSGIVEVRLTNTLTNIAAKDYYHELELVDALSNRVVSMTGTVTILPNVVNA
jgi:hypothetical protein